MRALCGVLSQPGGVVATMWHEGAATPVSAVTDAKCVDLLLFAAVYRQRTSTRAAAANSGDNLRAHNRPRDNKSSQVNGNFKKSIIFFSFPQKGGI